MIDISDDVSVMLSDFAIPATVNGVSVSGILDKEYALAFSDVAGSDTALIVHGGVAASRGDPVVIDSKSYIVGDVRDDDGIKRLMLRMT